MNVDEILPKLFLGSCPTSAEDVERLKGAGITAVLNVQTEDDLNYCGIDWEQLARCYRTSGIQVRRVPVRDFDHDHLREQLPEGARALDELLRAGHKVYVHCTAGINRSPSTVIAYLHWYEGQALDEAAEHVMQCRCCEPYIEAIQLASGDRLRR